MKIDDREFLQKTNDDVDAWMDGFYTDGHKASFRLHCQWAWQEQERRHFAMKQELLQALIAMNAQLEADGYMGTTYGPLRLAATKAIAKALGQ